MFPNFPVVLPAQYIYRTKQYFLCFLLQQTQAGSGFKNKEYNAINSYVIIVVFASSQFYFSLNLINLFTLIIESGAKGSHYHLK